MESLYSFLIINLNGFYFWQPILIFQNEKIPKYKNRNHLALTNSGLEYKKTGYKKLILKLQVPPV